MKIRHCIADCVHYFWLRHAVMIFHTVLLLNCSSLIFVIIACVSILGLFSYLLANIVISLNSSVIYFFAHMAVSGCLKIICAYLEWTPWKKIFIDYKGEVSFVWIASFNPGFEWKLLWSYCWQLELVIFPEKAAL